MKYSLKLVTYNIRTCWEEWDGINSGIHRMGQMCNKIDLEQPDVICFQEVTEQHARFFERHMPEYLLFYRGRLEKFDGEGLAVALRKETMELLSLDCFWLSPTPYVPASRFPEQSEYPRICQVVMARKRGTDTPFWIYNNHLDHISDQARILGIRQVMARVMEDQSHFAFPVFIAGDFNAEPGSETIEYCSNFADFPLTELNADCGGTFHDFGRELDNMMHIDYIYADRATAQHPYTVAKWTDESNGIYLSDHYPVCMEMEMEG